VKPGKLFRFCLSGRNRRLLNTCVFGLADFLVGVRRYLPCPGRGWRHFSPDTVTCPMKNATRSRGFEPASVLVAIVRSATPSSTRTIVYSRNIEVCKYVLYPVSGRLSRRGWNKLFSARQGSTSRSTTMAVPRACLSYRSPGIVRPSSPRPLVWSGFASRSYRIVSNVSNARDE